MCSSPALLSQRLYSQSVLKTMIDIINKVQEVLKVRTCRVVQGCRLSTMCKGCLCLMAGTCGTLGALNLLYPFCRTQKMVSLS